MQESCNMPFGVLGMSLIKGINMDNREPSKPKLVPIKRKGKESKIWVIYFKINGKEERAYSISKDKIDEKAKDIRRMIDENGGVQSTTYFANCVKLFLIYRATFINIEDGISRRHYENDERHMRLHINEFFDDKTNVSTINAGRINFFIDHMKKKGLSGKTRRAVLSTLNLMFKYAISMGWAENNPVSKTERDIIRGSSKDRVDYTLEEVNKLITAAQEDSPLYYSLFWCSALTGMAANELTGLQWQDIDFYKRKIDVKRTAWRGELRPTKTQFRERTIPLCSTLHEVLKDWQLKCNSNVFVFPSATGRHGDQDAWRKQIKHYCKVTGVAYKLNPNDRDGRGLGAFRKAFSTTMEERMQVPAVTNKYRMGHSKRSNTARHHYTFADMERAHAPDDYENLAEMIFNQSK